MTREVLNVWAQCMEVIRDNVDDEMYQLWFVPIEPIKLEGNEIVLRVPSESYKSFLETHCLDLLTKVLSRFVSKDFELFYEVVYDNAKKDKPYTRRLTVEPVQYTQDQTVNLKTTGVVVPHVDPFLVPGLRQVHVDPHLVASYSFDNFVEGNCNRTARRAALEVAKAVGTTPALNPYIIYGKTGLGKTHLANAIGLKVRELHPDKVVLYVNTEQFMSHFLRAHQNNRVQEFLIFYQNINLLIVDDVHDFANREGTQSIFFSLYNHLHQHGNQLVFTSDRPPVDLKGIRSDLLSRFKWGLSVELKEPDYQTRLKILKRKSLSDGMNHLNEDVLEFLAENVTSDVRELEGVLNSVMMHSILCKDQVTVEFARHVLRDLIIPKSSSELTIEQIQAIVAEYYALSIPDLQSKSRKKEIVKARQIAMYLSKEHTKHSVAYIGEHTGSKNHATVLHSCKVVKNLISVDRGYAQEVEELDRRVRSRGQTAQNPAKIIQ